MSIKAELGLIEETEYAEFRGMTLGAVRNERALGRAPPYQRIGRKVFYPLPALREFLAASTVKPSAPDTLIHGRRRRVKSASVEASANT